MVGQIAILVGSRPCIRARTEQPSLKAFDRAILALDEANEIEQSAKQAI